MKTKSALPLLAAILCALPLTASGTIRTWDDGGADANFSTAANWSPDGVPANGDDLVFPAAAPATVTNDLSSRTFDSLSFPAGVTLAGNAFTLTGGITLSNSGAGRSAVTITANITLGANQTFDCASGGSLNFDGSVLFGARTLTVTGARPCTFNGTTGSATAGSKLIKTGTGLLRVTTNAITNLPWDVSNGTLDVDGILQATVNLTGGKLTGDGTLTSLNATGGDIEPDAGGLSISGQTTVGGASRCLFHITGPATENRLSCGGLVDIAGSATLIVDTVGYTPVWNEDFQFITKTLAGPITGTFSNAADNSELPLGSTVTRVHYNGGNGNDLTLDTISTTRQWDGGDAVNDNWDDADNWTLNTRPNFGDVLDFPPGIQSSDRGMDNNFPNDTTFRQLVFRGDDFTVRGNRYKLSDGIRLEGPFLTVNLDTLLTLAKDQRFDLGNDTLHLGLLGEINTGGHVLTLAGGTGNGGGILDGKITGSGGVIIQDGTIISFGNFFDTVKPTNTYTGDTVIEQGATLRALGDNSLGSVAGPTRIAGTLEVGGKSDFDNRTIDEPLILLDGGELHSIDVNKGTNKYRGTMQLQGPGTMTLRSSDDSSFLTHGGHEIHGTLTGTGDLHFMGDWTITGSGNNTNAGSVTIDATNFTLKKTAAGANALGGGDIFVNFAFMNVEADEQIADAAHLHVTGTMMLGESVGHHETIGKLTLSHFSHVSGASGSQLGVGGDIVRSSGQAHIDVPLTIGGTPSVIDCHNDNGSESDLLFTGDVVGLGSASIRRTGIGGVTFSGSLSLTCELDAGDTTFSGISGTAGIVRLNGGNVGGTGTIGNLVSMAGGGHVKPGAVGGGTGTLTCRAVSWNTATHLDLDIKSASTFDQLSAVGGVSLGGAELILALDGSVGVGSKIVILANDVTDPIIGTFAGLPEGAFIPQSLGGWTISYHGGSGANDVELTRVNGPPVDPTPVLTAVTLGNPDLLGNRPVTVTGKGAPGISYRLEITIDLQQWTNGSTQTAAAGTGALSFPLTASPLVRKKEFYRIRKL